jgi:mRNA interferase MazF
VARFVKGDSYSIPIGPDKFAEGGLKHPSNIRPNRLITIDRHVILYRAGHLSDECLNEVVAKAVEILSK